MSLYCDGNMTPFQPETYGKHSATPRVFTRHFPVEMTLFMFLSQHGGTIAVFYLLKYFNYLHEFLMSIFNVRVEGAQMGTFTTEL